MTSSPLLRPPALIRALGVVGALVALIALGQWLPGRLGLAGAQPARPNVVLIVADDMRLDGLWALETVNRLAERGTTFSNFYATTPLCCPSRATILTGLYARHHGVLDNEPPRGGLALFDERSTLATWLQSAGVRTGLVGRYLNGYESEAVPPGWGYWFALWQANEEYSNYYRYRYTDNGVRGYHGSEPGAYSTRVLGARVKAFLEADRSAPFFLHFSPRAPHHPFTPDQRDSGVFKDREFPLPPSYNEEDVGDKPTFVRDRRRFDDDQLEEIELFRRRQWETLLSVDRVIAGTVELLEADGRLGDTWFIFTSDNGLSLGEHRRHDQKTCPYEECIHVPLVVVPPPETGVPRSLDQIVATIDLAPTIAAILGVEPAAPVDGRSLLPLLSGRASGWREAVVIEGWKDQDGADFVGVRTADRKYVRYGNGEEELYDEQADPHELDNHAADPSWTAEKARLAALLDDLLAERPR